MIFNELNHSIEIQAETGKKFKDIKAILGEVDFDKLKNITLSSFNDIKKQEIAW